MDADGRKCLEALDYPALFHLGARCHTQVPKKKVLAANGRGWTQMLGSLGLPGAIPSWSAVPYASPQEKSFSRKWTRMDANAWKPWTTRRYSILERGAIRKSPQEKSFSPKWTRMDANAWKPRTTRRHSILERGAIRKSP